MGYTIDLDTGGTCTDGLFSDGKNLTWVKVDTTPHDLTIAFKQCLEEGCRKLGFGNTTELLDEVDIIRWSTTVASNVIAERTGPKLGLFVTRGHEDDLYSTSCSPAIGYLVDRINIAGLPQPIDVGDFLRELKELLAKGVRRIVICLKGSFYDNKDEILLKDIIAEQYPEHYLGSVPILTGDDICKHPDDATRAHAALLNAYVHGPMATALFKEEDELREMGYMKPLLVGHGDGGVARVSKTKPIDTIESGPIFGIHGSAYFTKAYKLDKVVTLDVGGTTSKIGWIIDGRPVTSTENAVFGIPLKIPLVSLRSIALGGGTVANIDQNQKIRLGPKSMGAYPGPASYDLGGTEGTLTDAFVTLGYLDPNYFAGGTKKLNVERAKAAIQERIVSPLRIDLEKAAHGIADEALDMVADEIKKGMGELKIDSRGGVLFAFGGNGAIFGCNVAERIGVDRVYTFSIGSVFSTFGSSISDISHSYEYALFSPLEEYKVLHEIIKKLRSQVSRDMEGEGLDITKLEFGLNFQISDRKNPPIAIESEYLQFNSQDHSHRIKKLFDSKAPSNYSRENLTVELLKLKGKYPIPTPELTSFPVANPDPKGALKGKRKVYWKEGFSATNIYNWDLLNAGNVVEGPAIIESAYTTYLIPTNWRLKVDKYKNGVIEKRR